MANELGAFIRPRRIGGIAQRQFQSEVGMEISGFEVEVTKNPLFLARVLLVDVIANASFEIGGDLGAADLQLAAWTQAEVAPFETHRRQLVGWRKMSQMC